MFAQGQTTNKEIAKGGKVEVSESNLSPTAKLVFNMTGGGELESGEHFEGILPTLINTGLKDTANRIFREHLPANHTDVIKFCLDCRELEVKLNQEAQEAHCNEKEGAVPTNYVSKLIGGIKSAGDIQPEAPRETA